MMVARPMLLAILATLALPPGTASAQNFPGLPQPTAGSDDHDDDDDDITLPGVPRLRAAPALPGVMMAPPRRAAVVPIPPALPAMPAATNLPGPMALPGPAGLPAGPAKPTGPAMPSAPGQPLPPASTGNGPLQNSSTTTIYGRDENGNLTVPLGTVVQGSGRAATVNGQPVPPPPPGKPPR